MRKILGKKNLAYLLSLVLLFGCIPAFEISAASTCDSIGHSYTSAVTKKATCTDSGVRKYTCSVCSSSFEVSIASRGHTYKSVVTPPTCTAKGYTTNTCTGCGDSYKSNETNMVSHKIAKLAAVKASCENTGLTEGSYCSVCDKVIVAQTTVAATGHKWNSGSVTFSATCYGAGVKTYTCQNDSKHTKTEAISANGHTAGAAATHTTPQVCTVCNAVIKNATGHSYTAKSTVAATCTSKGYTTYACSCGDTYTGNYVKITGHNFSNWYWSEVSTCTKQGIEVRNCTKCTYWEYRAGAYLAHSYSNKVTAPTCTTQGYTTHTCTNCGYSYKDTHTAAKGHSFTSAVTKTPTCTASGVRTYTCSACSRSYTEYIPSDGHTLQEYAGSNPTPGVDGYAPYTACKKCSYTSKKTILANPAAGDVYMYQYGRLNVEPKASGESGLDGLFQLSSAESTEQYALFNTIQSSANYGSILWNIVNLFSSYNKEYFHHFSTSIKTVNGSTDLWMDVYGRLTVEIQVDADAETFELLPGKSMFANCKILAQSAGDTKWYLVGRVLNELPAGSTTFASEQLTEAQIENTYKYILSNTPVTNGTKKIRLRFIPDNEYGVQSGCNQGKISFAYLSYWYGRGDGKSTYTVPAEYKATDYPLVLKHTSVKTSAAVLATCSSAGKTPGQYCGECNSIVVSQETVAKYSHTWSGNATCTTSKHCLICGTVSQAALGHTYKNKVISVGCTTTGYTLHECSTCGYATYDTYVAAKGHTYTSKVTAATCSARGYTTYTCSACGDSYKDAYTSATGSHSYGSWSAIKSSCTLEIQRRKCNNCSYYETKSVTKSAHKYNATVTAPTCTQAGYTTNKCSVCGDTYTNNAKAKLGHAAGSAITENSVAATCSTQGSYDKAVYCTRSGCGIEISRDTVVVPLIEHRYTKTVIAPLCMQDGHTIYNCSCKNLYVDNFVDANGHSYTSRVTASATCTEAGVRTYTCSTCNSQRTETISAKGHSYQSTVTAPTCTTKGFTTYRCYGCGNAYKDNYVAAKGHSYNSVVTPPTCTAQGYTTNTCTNCGDTYQSAFLDAKGHSYQEVVKAPTCTARGYTTYSCSDCGYSYEDNYVEKTEHSYTGRIITDASCTTEGVMKYTCSSCGAVKSEAIPAKGHAYRTTTYTPGCTTQGFTQYSCYRCGYAYRDNYVDAIGHNTVIDEAVEPTYTSTGLTEGSHCSRCNEVFVAQQIIPAKEYVLGDATGNKTVDLLDLIAMKKALLDNEEYSVIVDMNKDNQFNALDILSLKKVLWESF